MALSKYTKSIINIAVGVGMTLIAFFVGIRTAEQNIAHVCKYSAVFELKGVVVVCKGIIVDEGAKTPSKQSNTKNPKQDII